MRPPLVNELLFSESLVFLLPPARRPAAPMIFDLTAIGSNSFLPKCGTRIALEEITMSRQIWVVVIF
jgi:hypothetical protein